MFGLANSAGARFDEFALYDRALTAVEVGCRYALATPGPCV